MIYARSVQQEAPTRAISWPKLGTCGIAFSLDDSIGIVHLLRVKFKIDLQYNETGEKDDHKPHQLGCF